MKRILSLISAAVIVIAALMTPVGAYTEAEVAAGEKAAGDYLSSRLGLSPAAVSGVLANMYAESKFLPYADYKGISYGICQWTGVRRERLFEYCEKNGLKKDSITAQLDFLCYELQSDYPEILAYMRNIPDTADGAYDAGYYWCFYFERPADKDGVSKTRGMLARDTFFPKRHICSYTEFLYAAEKHPHAPTYRCPGCGRTRLFPSEKTYSDDCPRCTVTPFHDVFDTQWFFEAAKYTYDNGIFNGTDKNHFSPNMNMTRAMVVTVIYRMEDEPLYLKGEGFDDIDSSDYFCDAVLWAREKGIVTGVTDRLFCPDDVITREQLVTLLVRYAAFRGTDTTGGAALTAYPDAGDVSGYAKKSFSFAISEGIITGTKPEGESRIILDPRGTATRAQVATAVMRFMQKYLPDFSA